MNFIFMKNFFLQSCRDAKLRREKTEEEVNELQNKSKTLEASDWDKFIFDYNHKDE